MERVGGDASFLEKLVLMSEKSKTGDVTTNETSAVDNRALIIPTTTAASTTDADGVEKVGCNDNDVVVDAAAVNKLSSSVVDATSPPPLPVPVTAASNVNGDNPYLNEDDLADDQIKKTKEATGNNRLESESKALEDSAQRETPAADDEAPSKGKRPFWP